MSAQTAPAGHDKQQHHASWFQRMTSTFPLSTYDAVPVISSKHNTSTSRRSEPVLYVAEGHPRVGQTAAASSSNCSWASRDPQSLAWQMQLLFRGVRFECANVPQDDVFHPAHPGEGFARIPVLLDTDGTIVGRKHLARWADTVKPFPAELNVATSTAEARILDSLLQGPLMAGVLLSVVLLPTPSSLHAHLPFFTRQVQRNLVRHRKARMVAQIAAVQHVSPTTRIPGWTTQLYGLLGGAQGGFTDTGTAAEGPEGEDEEDGGGVPLAAVELDHLDQATIVRDACEAIQIIADLFPAQGEWLVGHGPSHLDALLFALLHTVLSLPTESDAPTEPLRSAIEASPRLTAYIRRIWRDYVKSKGG